MIKIEKIFLILLLAYASLIQGQSIEIISFDDPLEISPLLGGQVTVDIKYTSEPGATSNHIFVGLEVLDQNNQYVSYVNGVTLNNQQSGADIQKSVSFFVGSINKLSSELPSGHYYQLKATLYASGGWNANAWAGYWNTSSITLQDSNGYNFNTKTISKGADISWMTEMESQGYTWRDNAGNSKQLMPLLKEYDMDAVRLRVWVNPENSQANGWCDIDDLVVKAEQAKNNGLDVMVCIHYSDWWADPGQQNKPSAWSSYSVSQLEAAVASHTTDILNALNSKGITPRWIQIGNETNDGMLWPTGKASTGGFVNYAKFINAGANAVKSFNSDIKTILHLANANDNSVLRWNLDGLHNNGLQSNNIDIIGLSLYPDDNNWKQLVDDAHSSMLDIKSRYNKDVMMVEIGFSYSRPDITYQYITYIIERVKELDGLGVFYWEPIARSPFTNYSKGAWDSDDSPSIAMDAFIDKSTLSVPNFNENTNMILVYPNPALNELILTSKDIAQRTFNIYDLTGRLVSNGIIFGPQNSVDISELSSGIYLLKITNSPAIRFVKK